METVHLRKGHTSPGGTPNSERALLKKEGAGFPITVASIPEANCTYIVQDMYFMYKSKQTSNAFVKGPTSRVNAESSL